jgi:hypothetical protein
MQAIQTKFHGPTNFKGSRISAKCEAKRIIVSYEHALNGTENHEAAALELIRALGWDRDGCPWFGDRLPDGSMVFVCAGRAGIGEGSHTVNQLAIRAV